MTTTTPQTITTDVLLQVIGLKEVELHLLKQQLEQLRQQQSAPVKDQPPAAPKEPK